MHVNPLLDSFLVYKVSSVPAGSSGRNFSLVPVSSGSGRNLQYWFRCTPNENDDLTGDINDYILALRPESTVKKTKYDLNVWNRYLDTINESRQIENIPPDELNVLLCRFFMDIKKKDGKQYEPTSLTSLHRSLQRHLNDKGSPINLFFERRAIQLFKRSTEVLSARKKELVVRNAKKIVHKQLESSQPTKKMNFFVWAILPTQIPRLCKEPYGGCCRYTSGFVPVIKAEG